MTCRLCGRTIRPRELFFRVQQLQRPPKGTVCDVVPLENGEEEVLACHGCMQTAVNDLQLLGVVEIYMDG